jgi:hypothetical protein
MRRRIDKCCAGDKFKSLGFLLLSHLLDFAALVLNLLLLLLQLALGLLILHLPVLHLVANHISAAGAEGAANCSSCARMTHRGPDDCAGAGAEQGAYTRTFFALAQRLSGTSRNQECCGERQCRGS